MLSQVGRGRTSIVYRVRHKITGAMRVLRTIPASKYKDDACLLRQIDVLKAADHPNIVRLYGQYAEGGAMHVILQYCSGGSVLDRITRDAPAGGDAKSAVVARMELSWWPQSSSDKVERVHWASLAEVQRGVGSEVLQADAPRDAVPAQPGSPALYRDSQKLGRKF